MPGNANRLMLIGAAVCMVAALPANAFGADSKIETAGTVVAIALPVAAGGISLLHDQDWNGVGQLTLSTAATVGAALILKQNVHAQRPDHSDFNSFTSETAALT